MKLLFLTSRSPVPPIGGDRLRTYHFLKFLSKYFDVTLITFYENEKELLALNNEKSFKSLIKIRQKNYRSYLNAFKGLLSKEPLQVHYYHSKEMKKAVLEELNREHYDVVFCHLIRMAQYLPESGVSFKAIDFTDAISLNYKRSKNFRKGIFSIVNRIEAKRVFEYELEMIDHSDLAIFISEIDADFLRNENNKSKFKIVSNGVDFKEFPLYQGKYDANKLCFVGNMRTFPNIDAVLHFVHDIFPSLKKILPNVEFYIVGNTPDRNIKNLHNGKDIFVTGFVESVKPYIEQSLCMVAPMRVGAGVQNKILESLALGTPVVTTSIGAEGLDSNSLLIANNADQYCTEIRKLFESEKARSSLSMLGRKYIEDNYNWESNLIGMLPEFKKLDV